MEGKWPHSYSFVGKRVSEALQEGCLFEEIVCSVYFLNVFLGHPSPSTQGGVSLNTFVRWTEKFSGSYQGACHICRVQASGCAARYIHLVIFFQKPLRVGK